MDQLKVEHISHFETGLLAPPIEEYIAGNLNGLVHYPFDLEGFRKAMEGKYAIPAYNFNNLEQQRVVTVETGMLTMVTFTIFESETN